MFARQTEKLIILGDTGVGYLNRVYQLLAYKRPLSVFTPDIDKFARALYNPRKFPDFPTDLPKQSGFEQFRTRADNIRNSLSDYVLTLSDCLTWFDETARLLSDLNQSLTQLAIEHNQDLTNYYCNLMQRYVQLHLLIAQLETPQLNLAIYCYALYVQATPPASYATSGSQPITVPLTSLDGNYIKLSSYFTKYGKSPLKQLQNEHASLGKLIGVTITSKTVIDTVNEYNEKKTFMDNNLFKVNVLAPSSLTAPLSAKEDLHYSRIIFLDRFRQWILYSFLLCPDIINSHNGAVELLNDVLTYDPNPTLYRDLPLGLQKELTDIFDQYKGNKSSAIIKKYKKSAMTMTMSTNSSQSAELLTMFKNHSELRTYLRQASTTLVNLFREYPTLMSIKLPMILALLNICRDEVIWFIRHCELQTACLRLNKDAESAKLLAEEENASVLLLNVQSLSELMIQHRAIIQEYYLAYINSIDVPNIASTISETIVNNSSGNNFDPLLTTLINNIYTALTNPAEALTIADNFEAIRLNWYRVSLGLTSLLPKLLPKLSTPFGPLVLHTRYIDTLDSQLRYHGSFSMLYWHFNELEKFVTLCLNGTNGQQAACVNIVKIFSSTLLNVHRLCPEEQIIIGQASITMCDKLLRTISKKVDDELSVITREYSLLREQTSATSVLRNVASQSPVLPGFESFYENRRGVARLRQSRATVIDIANSFDLNGDKGILVYNVSHQPREYLLDTIFQHLKYRVKSIAFTDANQLAMQKPSIMLNRWRDSVAVLASTLERVFSFSLSDIARNVLLQEFTSEEDLGVENRDDRATIFAITAFYSNLFSRDLNELGIVYSPVHRVFVNKQGASATAGVYCDIQRFTDPNELRALVSLIGPGGARLIIKQLLNIIGNKLTSIKAILVANRDVAARVQHKFHDTSLLQDAINNARDLDQLVQHTVAVGAILHFRALMREALGAAIEPNAKFIGETLSLASSISHTAVRSHQSLTVLDLLAADCGVDPGEADFMLRHVLSKVKQSDKDAQVLSLAPEVYALSLAAKQWRSAQYSTEYGGHLNNAHCQPLAIYHFLVSWSRTPVNGRQESEPEVNARIDCDYRRFAHCSAKVVHHIYQTATNINIALSSPPLIQSMKDLSMGRDTVKLVNERLANEVGGVSAMLAYFDAIVAASGGRVDYALLETSLPFTIIRENYSAMEEKTSFATSKTVASSNFSEEEMT